MQNSTTESVRFPSFNAEDVMTEIIRQRAQQLPAPDIIQGVRFVDSVREGKTAA